jgi:hypothetical protein
LRVLKGNKDERGILNIDEFKLLSVCLLGDGILEGIEGSNLSVLRFSLSDYNNFYQTFAKKPTTNFPKQGDNKDIKLSNSNYKQFDYEYALKIKEEYSEIWHKGGEEFGNQAFELWTKARDGENSKSVQNWIKRRESFAARHHKDINLPGIVANMKWGTIVSNGEKYMKDIIQEAIDKLEEKQKDKDVNNNFNEDLNFIAEDELGSKPAIKINKSKDAMSNSAWGDEDKSQLKKDCLMAKNYKTLCKSVFLRCEKEYLEGKEGALGYPVMEKKGDEVIYNRNGLASAKSYATKNNENEILSDLKSIYKHLDLAWDDEKEGENVEDSKKEMEKDEEIKNTEDMELNSENKEVETNSCSEDKHVEGCSCNSASEPEPKEEFKACEKCMALEEEMKNIKEEVAKYKRIEEEQKMSSLLNSFSHCFSKEEKEGMFAEIKTHSYEDFEKKVDNKIKEFVAKMKDDKKDEEPKKEEEKKEEEKKEDIKNTVTFSVSPFFNNKFDFSKNLGEENGLDGIIKNSNVKIK